MHGLVFYLYVTSRVSLAAAVVIFVRRGLHKRFPFFFAYTLCELAYFLALIAAYVPWVLFYPTHVSKLYYGILVFGLGATVIFELGVLYELADELMLSRSLTRISRPVLRWSAATLLLFAAIVSALLSKPDMPRVISVFQTLDFSANLIKIGLLLVVLSFTSALGITWKSLPAGIALGFGVSAAAQMAGMALLSLLGKSGYLTSDLIRTAAFHVCVVIWLVYILLPEKQPKLTGKGLSASELESWDQELQEIIRR